MIHFRERKLYKLIVGHNFQLHYQPMELFTHGKSLKLNNFISFNFFLQFLKYFRGKGDYFRLGHGTNDHVRKPKPVSGLHGKRIIQFATGLKNIFFFNDSF